MHVAKVLLRSKRGDTAAGLADDDRIRSISGWSKRAVYFAVLVAYLAMSLWLTGATGQSITRSMLNESGDPNVFVFFLKWWPWALLHGQNPFMFQDISYPVTYNAAWMTSIPGPALLAAPVTLVWGPVAAWNILMLFAPVAAAGSMFALLDVLESSYLASLIGGFIFGFGSYEIGQMAGHIFLILIFPIPLVLMVLLLRLQKKIKPKWFVAVAILSTSFLFYTSIEIALTTFISATAGMIIFLFFFRREFLNVLFTLWREWLAIAIGIIILCLPLIYYLMLGLNIGGVSINSPTTYSTDLLNFVIPTPVTALGSSIFFNIANSFSGNFSENGGYIGIVLLLTVAIAIAEGLRRARWVKPLAIFTLVITVFTLGPFLHVAGTTTSVRLPWYLVFGLPIFKDILPARLMLYVSLVVAIWTALWISWGSNLKSTVLRSTLVLVGVVLIWPSRATFQFSNPNIPKAVSNGELASFVGKQTGVLVLPQGPALPFSQGNLGALWAEASDFKIKVTRPPWGYNPYSSGVGYVRWIFSSLATNESPVQGSALQLEIFCSVHSDGVVAVPTSDASWIQFLDGLNWVHRTFSGVSVYRVPETVMLKYAHVTAQGADTSFYLSELNALSSAADCYLLRGGKISDLTPDSAIAYHCLSASYAGQSNQSNWTVAGGWIGAQGQNIGIGLEVNGSMAHAVFSELGKSISNLAPVDYMVYDPRPRTLKLSQMSSGIQAGTVGAYLLIVRGP